MVRVLTFILELLNNSCHTLEIVVNFLISPFRLEAKLKRSPSEL